MSESLRISHPNSKASQRYQKRHKIKPDVDPKRKNRKTFSKKRKKFNHKNKHKLQISREEMEAPKSFIIIRGRVTKYCKFLRDDLRLIFSPYTAAKLREKQSNSLKDFIVSSTEFGVTHLMTLSQSDIAGTMLRMIRLPKGPTFWFQVKEYSLIQDIVKMQFVNKPNQKKWHQTKKNKWSEYLPKHIQFSFRFAPLVILNGFSVNNNNNNNDERPVTFNRTNLYHKQLMAVMFKHMFCPINVIKTKLNQCKRVVFFNYDNKNDCVQIRHYKIQIANDLKGVSKGIKKIIKNERKKNEIYPDLSGYDDIKDYVMANKEEYVSESECEDDENTKVVMERINKDMKKNKNNMTSSSYVRLKEIGPRIDMELVKIEELINDGKVLYHRYVNKTNEEIKKLQMKKDMERMAKEKRIIKQEFNVKKKVDMKKERANKRLEDRKKREVEKLLKGFEINDKNENDGKVGQKRGILKNKNGNNNGPVKKKRKVNKKRVKFDS